ncbi:MAG TPA: NAD(P)(+) transhydrogenase (Re/Si-specific) subunit beta [Longimicrobium sp.]|nr:NAD(P)(+) transhydrogenase (Re/Si-specific) subunit beta [Longimicrobium sp.]
MPVRRDRALACRAGLPHDPGRVLSWSAGAGPVLIPILNADHAKSVVVLERSLAAGCSGVENELFYHPCTAMLFGDAKRTIKELVAEVKALRRGTHAQ